MALSSFTYFEEIDLLIPVSYLAAKICFYLKKAGKNEDLMTQSIVIGGCVKIPDGRIARVRERINNQYKVRVRRQTSASHQFLFFEAKELTPVDCPKGWMSVEGYKRYLKITLAKMKARQKSKK